MKRNRTHAHRSTFPALGGLIALLALAPLAVSAKAREVGPHQWEGVERVIVLGDVHGDYDQYMAVLEAAGLVNKRGRWDGGDTHFVQTGDIPDRGPDTRKIMDHLARLQQDAEKKGGRVHTLIGNHDAMNVYGDLRYVTPGEYAAFEGRGSERLREAQWEHHIKTLEARDPEGFAAMDLEAFRKEWEADYPLGWVEHRQAWIPDGEYGAMVLDHPLVVRINDTLFVHGGLSAKYCDLSLEDMTDRAHDEMSNYNYAEPGMIEDPLGPLWYRGLATGNETQLAPMLDAVLERYEAERIVVGHTPTQGVVWPRFDGKVILNDVGLAAHYGAHFAFLELKDGQAIAHYRDGNTVPLPENNAGRLAYLERVVALDPDNAYLQSRLEKVRLAAGEATGAPEAPDLEAMSDEDRAAYEQEQAWLSPDNCR
ncbi:MAG: metallophosphoesterase [Xanthomonadales bacterium]|nr:metallophosphoesterase [Xanthomonadales bacterium]